MPRPFGTPIALDTEARSELEALVRARSTPQALALRCNVVLAAARAGNPSNLDIADLLGCDRHTAAKWRERYAAAGLAGLQDAPRSGRPRSFSPRRGHRRHRHGQQQDRGA